MALGLNLSPKFFKPGAAGGPAVSAKTVCARDCYDTCTLVARRPDDPEKLSIKGDPRHPLTRGLLCKRAAADHLRLTTSRVDAPYARTKNGLQKISWEAAADLIAERVNKTLSEEGPESLLFLNYSGNSGLLSSVFPQRLWNALGATQTDESICNSSGRFGLQLHYGAAYGIDPLALPEKKMIVFWGFNAAVSAPHIWQLAKWARKKHGAVIVAIDPVKTRTAEQADLWVRPNPGSDVALAYGVIHELIRRDQVDLKFIEKWTVGFDALRKAAEAWPPHRIQSVCGISSDILFQLTGRYASSKPSATMIGIGLQKWRHGADQVRAISFIPTLLGFHRGFFFSNGDAHMVDEGYLKGLPFLSNPPKRVSQVGLAELVQAGTFGFMHVSCMNPAITLPNQTAFRSGLSRDDLFLSVHDTHWSKTTEYADIVLPALTFWEKDDVVIPWTHNRIRYSKRVMSPFEQGKTEGCVMRMLARRLGLSQKWLYEDESKALDRALAGSLESGDFGNLVSGADLTLKRKPENRYPTPSGKIEFVSSAALKLSLPPLPEQPEHDDIDGNRFCLLNSAVPEYTHTQFQEIHGPIAPVIRINPADAKRIGIEESAVVRVSNEQGAVLAKAEMSERVPIGSVWAPHENEGLCGSPQNSLTSSRPQPIGGGPTFNDTWVDISPAAAML